MAVAGLRALRPLEWRGETIFRGELTRNAAARPSAWVKRFADIVPRGGDVLDLACGSGRHTRLFLDRGHPVVAVDIDLAGIADLADHPRLEALEVDLEDGRPFPQAGRRFGGVVVTHYLHRPLLPAIIAAVEPGGVLIYETFARGQERLGRPRSPEYLLEPGELLEAVRGRLRVIAYENLIVEDPHPAAVERICALRQGRPARAAGEGRAGGRSPSAT